MKIIWIYNVYVDFDGHITTWREMYNHLRDAFDIYHIFPYCKYKKGFSSSITYVRHNFFIPYLKRIIYIVNIALKYVFLAHRVKPDIVVLDLWSCPLTFLPIPHQKKVKYFLDFRTYEYNENSNTTILRDKLIMYWTKIALKINRRYHAGITFISQSLKYSLISDLHERINPNQVIWPSGVDRDVFTPVRSDIPDYESHKFRIFFHGQLNNNRGLTNMIRALRIVIDNKMPVELVIVGDGSAKASLMNMADKYDLKNDIQFLGFRHYEEIPDLISTADVCVMAYPHLKYWDVNVPLKILEYMAMGKVIILTRLKVFLEIAGNADYTIYIDNNDPELIAEAIAHAYKNRTQLKSWGRAGRDRIRNSYEWKTVAKTFEHFLISTTKSVQSRL